MGLRADDKYLKLHETFPREIYQQSWHEKTRLRGPLGERRALSHTFRENVVAVEGATGNG